MDHMSMAYSFYNRCISVINRCADDKPFVPIYQVSKEMIKRLGIDYIPFEQSLKGNCGKLEGEKLY